MKYYLVWYDKCEGRYKIEQTEKLFMSTKYIALFTNFDMAYQYISTLNGNVMSNVYSRWATRK